MLAKKEIRVEFLTFNSIISDCSCRQCNGDGGEIENEQQRYKASINHFTKQAPDT